MKNNAAFVLGLCLLLCSCQAFKMGQLYLSKNHRKPAFPREKVSNQSEKTFFFSSGEQRFDSLIANMPAFSGFAHEKDMGLSFDDYLDKKTKTTAFLVIRRDSILFERYYGGYDEKTLFPSFSVAKSFTSALVGIALEEGHLGSVDDPVTDYLPELLPLHANWKKLTLAHLLDMRSGLGFDEDSYSNPWSDIADLFFSKNVSQTLADATFVTQPGNRHYYSSLDTQILGLVLERATGLSLAEYLSQKIWQPLGMESPAFWAIDSKRSGNTKAFCCLQARARDYAKFGLLYLQKGKWEGKQVVPKDWVQRSTQANFANGCYQCQWYSGNKRATYKRDSANKMKLLVYPDSLSAAKAVENPLLQRAAPHWSNPGQWIVQNCGPQFFAMGVFGQEIYVSPEQQLVFVRLGTKWDLPTLTYYARLEHLLKEL